MNDGRKRLKGVEEKKRKKVGEGLRYKNDFS
jgi:hypothetical protein